MESLNSLLDNPVYHALLSGDAQLARGHSGVKYFDEEISPFVGFSKDNDAGFGELHAQLPAGRRTLYATRKKISEPEGWKLLHEIEGLQFVYTSASSPSIEDERIVPLGTEHVDEMVQLATLTKPGPFARRTIEFGHYHGIFVDGRLAAMTGQRLHVEQFTEVSAVCTHPDFLGRGFAAALLHHQISLILQQGKTPFLHVRADNARAIALYERLGFVENGVMNFYFMKRDAVV
ncbi:MAG TPA: GNAT family N-acetyltransferase [Chitinophagaceae bacterium]|nr:GNAT family N-acetyltransferase [Chitinophagaceae bacterium]